MVIGNLIKVGAYHDSVALMQTAQKISCIPGVSDVSLVMGTDANKALLRHGKLAAAELDNACADDLVIAVAAEPIRMISIPQTPSHWLEMSWSYELVLKKLYI